MTIRILFLLLAAYLLGSIPFSHFITKWRTGLVIREVGEGNVGSRNVWHVVGPRWGVLAFALDMLKGLAVYLGGLALGVPIWGIGLAGIAAVLGHQFSFFLHGQGGKGLATMLGVILGLSPLAALGGLALLGLAYVFFRDFNPSVIVSALGVIFLPLVVGPSPVVTVYALGMVLMAGVKKLLDRQHETQVWGAHPWEGGGKPGFHHAEGSDQAASQDANAH
ncbi:MAG TPA: glycerol-3-phosphate acyltransferase [Ktedonobacterales bacterium]|jgi:glycerol-3-phosphate acyltransferase PlsY